MKHSHSFLIYYFPHIIIFGSIECISDTALEERFLNHLGRNLIPRLLYPVAVLSSVSRCLEPLMKHSHSFLIYYFPHIIIFGSIECISDTALEERFLNHLGRNVIPRLLYPVADDVQLSFTHTATSGQGVFSRDHAMLPLVS